MQSNLYLDWWGIKMEVFQTFYLFASYMSAESAIKNVCDATEAKSDVRLKLVFGKCLETSEI